MSAADEYEDIDDRDEDAVIIPGWFQKRGAIQVAEGNASGSSMHHTRMVRKWHI